MRPATVLKPEIISAGIQLQQQGKAVNGFSLRTVCGAGNPKRLMRIWEESCIAQEEVAAQANGNVIPSAPHAAPHRSVGQRSHSAAEPAELVELQGQLYALRAELARSQQDNQSLAAQLQQSNVVANAVTDELTRSKLRCAQLEAKEVQQEQRIAELHARVAEQRGELNRASQARLALQKSIDALTAHGQHSQANHKSP
jgi:septal ring factor EnvC (AmiA/AmiB activator)